MEAEEGAAGVEEETKVSINAPLAPLAPCLVQLLASAAPCLVLSGRAALFVSRC